MVVIYMLYCSNVDLLIYIEQGKVFPTDGDVPIDNNVGEFEDTFALMEESSLNLPE